MHIANVLYPRSDAEDWEIERLDGVQLQEGTVMINGCGFLLDLLSAPEYESNGKNCITVTYRWLKTHVA